MNKRPLGIFRAKYSFPLADYLVIADFRASPL